MSQKTFCSKYITSLVWVIITVVAGRAAGVCLIEKAIFHSPENRILELKKQLPILGGHILMATDSPKEMGFVLSQGNNMRICLEPSTCEETKRLFDGLSEGGSVTMPLQDIFFGSYYGSCTDRFGINWMLNCIRKDN